MKRKSLLMLGLCMVLLLALPLTVLADKQEVDSDLGAPGNQNIVDLGTVVPGAALNTSGQLVISYSGGNHLSAGDVVTFVDAGGGQTTLPAGYYSVSPVTVTVPTPWTSGGTVGGTSTVSFTAPAEDGSYLYTVKWATADYGNKLTGAPALVINLAVVSPPPTTCTTPPLILIAKPLNGDIYILNEPVTANWAVTDGGCGVASSEGTVANGSLIDTSTVGTKQFTVSATDNYDNDSSQTNIYSVVYDFGEFLPPLGPGPKEFKAGSTIPVKFQLFDFNNNVVDNASGNASVAGVSASIRYDATAGQYIANLKTLKGVAGTFELKVNLNDGSAHTTSVILKP